VAHDIETLNVAGNADENVEVIVEDYLLEAIDVLIRWGRQHELGVSREWLVQQQVPE
jgi:hypothetical protein